MELWGYIDERDAATACRLAAEAAADTVMNRPSAELLREVYPDTPLIRDIGEYETLPSIDSAKRVLGFNPEILLPAPRSARPVSSPC